MFEKKYVQESRPYRRDTINNNASVKNIYWGEVVSIDDPTEGGVIRARVPELDTQTPNQNIPLAYPLLPKYFHVYPQVGETVRIFIENPEYPQRSRFWMGSIVSQLQKIAFEGIETALNTTNVGRGRPEKAPSEFPEAQGVFPTIDQVALIGRNNTDIILKDSEVQIRAGKHEVDNVLKLNRENPSSINMVFEQIGSTNTRSSTIMLADKIAILSHDGDPKFKSTQFEQTDRDRVFSDGHPMVRGDILVRVLERIRQTIVNHVHPYPKLPADKSNSVPELEALDFNIILQENIVIN
jgi:hypothetical protein